MDMKPEAPDVPPRNPLRILSSASTASTEKSGGSIDLGKTNEPTKNSQQISPNKISNDLKTEDEKSTTTELEIVETDVKNNNSDVKCEKIEEISEKDNEVKKEIMECKENGHDSEPQSISLQDENHRLSAEVVRLKQIIEKSDISPSGLIENIDINSLEEQSNDSGSCKIERLENELRIAKELIQSLKVERKKLRSDKSDLLQQVKHLCASLQEKEQELRNFIRNFEQRIRDSETLAAKASSDSEHDRWTLIKHAHDEAERSLALAAQLNVRDMQLQRVSEQLMEARRQLGCVPEQEGAMHNTQITSPSGILNHGCDETELILNTTPGDRGSCSADSGVRGSSDRESAAGDMNLSDGACENETCITVDSDSISLVSSHHNMNQYGTPKEFSPSVSPMNTLIMERTSDKSINYNRNVMELPVDLEGASTSMARRLKSKPFNSLVGRAGRGGAWGSISRVFARSKNRKSSSQDVDGNADFQWNSLTEESYAEKIRLLREASSIAFENWRVPQILAWLEVALGMPKDCIRLCSENVKSGKVLLELSDAELESGLGATHPMHRKKLRLAIEEQRRPDFIRYPTIAQLGHSWTALEWLHDIGLSQYSESFLHSLVDARMLDTLSKKELEKYLGVTRKFHQASIVHGIHLLRLMKYDRQSLAMRRMQCENNDSDPIVWTNQRFIRWVRSIDLGEYAENLRNSGVHGGLVVLEASFSGETMATALGIPPSKNIVRRHLMTEFDSLIIPARATLTQGFRAGATMSVYERHANGSLSKSYVNPKAFKAVGNPSKSMISPTHSLSSSEGGYGMYTGHEPNRMKNEMHEQPFLSIMSSQYSMNNHRISAPPTMSSQNCNSTLPRYVDHRRVKSISDIETAATNTHNQTNCSQTSVNKIVSSSNEYNQKN